MTNLWVFDSWLDKKGNLKGVTLGLGNFINDSS